MKYNQFEDLPVWQQSRQFLKRVYVLTRLNQSLVKDYSLVDQLRRAATSVMLNISEGFERGGNKEFANFINIAKGSAGEVRSILYILLDNGYITEANFNDAKKEIVDLSSSLSNFHKYLLHHSSYKKFSQD